MVVINGVMVRQVGTKMRNGKPRGWRRGVEVWVLMGKERHATTVLKSLVFIIRQRNILSRLLEVVTPGNAAE